MNLEQRLVPENTTSTSLLSSTLNDADINASRSKLDEIYVKLQMSEDQEDMCYVYLADHYV